MSYWLRHSRGEIVMKGIKIITSYDTLKTLRHIYSIPIHEDSPKPSSFVMIIDELAYYHFFFASCRHLEERLP